MLGGQAGSSQNGTTYQLAGQMGHPPTSPDSIRSAAHAAARVNEVRLERIAHSNSPSLQVDGGSIMNCIGVDVSKQVLITYDGTKVRSFPNHGTLTQFSKYLDLTKHVLIVFEPTSTYSHRLQAFCAARGIRTCQLNPRVVPNLRKVSHKRCKTDQTDAQLLYQYGVDRGQTEGRTTTHIDPLVHKLSTQLSLYRVTQKSRVAYQGLLEALTNDPFTDQALLDQLHETICSLKQREAACVSQAQAVINQDEEAASKLQALLSIPGLGPISSITLFRFLRKYECRNRQQAVALSGLDPISHESGTSVHRKDRISKNGERELRKRLYEATLSAARFNPSVKNLYQRLKKKGKPEKVARTAAARKLLLIAHAIYKTGQLYHQPNQNKG